MAIFASGNGSNAKKIIEYFHNHQSVAVKLVVSNRPSAPVLKMAAANQVETHVVSRQSFYETKALLDLLKNKHIDYLILAGFLWLIPEYLVDNFRKKIINIHPALLPKYGGKGMYGMNVHQAVFEAKETESGISIHFVNAEYDEGELIFQTSCMLTENDTPQTIAAKVLELEHQHFPPTIERILCGQ